MLELLEHIKVKVDPNKSYADTGEVLIGLGNTQEKNEGIVLQHKTEATRYECLSHYVYEKDFALLNIDSCQTVFVEDFSVDTILSIWIFLHKVSHVPLPNSITNWIAYAKLWEEGDTSNTGKPFHSYGCLQNSLSLHLKDKEPKQKLEESLLFLDLLMKNDINPSNIPDNLQTKQYFYAKQALESEYEKYQNLLLVGEIVILSIPDTNSKRVKVSAIFIETAIVSSIQKVFLRNDENSPTKDGYGFMAVYNVSAKGTGNDIVISVDPLKKIQLKALWEALEQEEEYLWNSKRPHDNPRPLTSYPYHNGPNQPWWDDMGKYTLLAAPKMLGNVYGRRTSWETVKQLIKQLYKKESEL